MTDPLVGTTVAHYEVLGKLGGGGMGVVYTARDTKLGRRVALKFLPPEWSHDESAKQRFIREAQAASATDHRNICTIHDIDTAPDGRLFIVMAQYDGPTLKQRLEQGPLPTEEAVEIAAQLADGLARAHAQGVVHRDVKPGNIILAEDGPRILDFGLARFAGSLNLTFEGSTLGTVAYMSPEQSRGDDPDGRSDIWSIGVVLYEMLTGERPFRGGYPEAITHAIRTEQTPALHQRSGENLDAVERVIRRALEKDPSQRYQSARDLLKDLRLIQGRTVPMDFRSGTLVLDEIPKPKHRTSSARRLVVATAAAIAAIAGTLTWLFLPVAGVPIVVAPVVNQTGYAELEPYRLALTQELVAELSDSASVLVVPYERELPILRGFRSAAQDVSSREAVLALSTNSGAQVVVAPTLLYENGAWKARVEFRDAATATNIAVQETDAIVSSLMKDTANALMPQVAAAVESHFVRTGPLRARIANQLRTIAGRGSPPLETSTRSLDAAAHLEHGLDAYDRLEYEAARTAFAEAARADPRDPIAAAWRSRVATIMRHDQEAAESADEAMRLLADRAPTTSRSWVRAVAAEGRRDFSTAEAQYRALVDSNPGAPLWLMELGFFHDRRLKTTEAIEAFSGALAADSRTPRAHLELCRMYSPARQNEPASAKTHGNAALSVYRSMGDRSGEAQALLCLADTQRLGNTADRQAARQNAEAARAIFEQTGSTYQRPRADYYVALVEGATGNMPAAIAAFEQSLVEAKAGVNTVLQPLLLMNLGVAHNALGHRATAAAYYRESAAAYEALGDEQRAAQQQANGAALTIEYGPEPAQGLRDVQNALAVFRKLGDKNFEVFCLQLIAARQRFAGRHDEAQRTLNQALAISRERNLTHRIAPLTLDMAKSMIETGDDAEAKKILFDALGDGSGPAATEIRLYLARAAIGLRDFAGAREHLDVAARDIESRGDENLAPLLHETRGELAYASNNLADARTHFSTASALWIDDTPDAASVQARAYLGLLDGLAGRLDSGRAALRQSLDQARRMQRALIERRIEGFQARVAPRARK
jgi:tetratricopeptide (TPR) repeat protein